MDDKHGTIGLPDLLDEVSRDLEDFRRKHASDYALKAVTLWWELQKERLLVRHAPTTVVRTATRVARWRRGFVGFAAGAGTLLAAQAALRLLN